MSVLEVNHITGGYGRKTVLHDVSFEVGEGELVGLIGLNGAGKSTTIKHIIGLLQPTAGECRIAGKSFRDDPGAYRSAFTYIPESPSLYEELTLREHLELTALAYRIPESVYERRVASLLEQFRMGDRLHWFPAHFSKGMRQKVMILCAFLASPQLYMIDEPFVGLDPLAIRALLRQLDERKREGAGILMSTHVLSTAEAHCDRIVLLNAGRIRAQGTMADLQQAFGMPGASLDDLYIAMTEEPAGARDA